MQHERRVNESIAKYSARQMMELIDQSSMGKDACLQIFKSLGEELKKGGRNLKSMQRIQRRLMKQNKSIRRLRFGLNRKEIVATFEMFYLTDVTYQDHTEEHICIDTTQVIYQRKTGKHRMSSYISSMNEHTVGRIMGRLDNDPEPIIQALYFMNASILEQVEHGYATGTMFVEYPLPYMNGLLFCHNNGERDPDRGYATVGIDARTFVSEEMLRPDQIEMRDHILDEGMDALYHYPNAAKLGSKVR